MSNRNIHIHIGRVSSEEYYKQLIIVRDIISSACDEFFREHHAPKVDLYMLSQSISSPMGKGSDSKPVSINFINQSANLVDSAQFGMEPLVINSFPMVYCYLPSFRGEDPDNYHLNQFYHCEAEMRGDMKQAMGVASSLIAKIINRVIDRATELDAVIGNNRLTSLKSAVGGGFPSITFDDAHSKLKAVDREELVIQNDFGRTLSKEGEKLLVEIVSNNTLPVWLTHYDVDTVPFYQKEDPEHSSRSLTADLLFPTFDNCIGGEILGLGQRQDSAREMLSTMKRQGIKDTKNFDWYIKLRDNANYHMTSGFGLGIERLTAWVIGAHDIADAAIYPISIANEIGY